MEDPPTPRQEAVTLACQRLVNYLELMRRCLTRELEILRQVGVATKAAKKVMDRLHNDDAFFKEALEVSQREYEARLDEMTLFMDESQVFIDSEDDAEGLAKLKEWEENNGGIIH